ncbi:YrdB family protein [Xylanimonas sp. McL0601]|uniref:YrdB family protein n=1 Tax=Xylanimonas sp. McL0601 TaxID=3414739 RepID=UPI003CEF90D3
MTAMGQPDPDLPSGLDVTSSGWRGVALLVRFVLELALLAGVAWSVWTACGEHWWRWPAAAIAPVVVGIMWGAWLSPRAPHRPAEPVRVLIEALLFGGVGGMLWWHGHPWLGVALAGAWALDRAVIATSSRPRQP